MSVIPGTRAEGGGIKIAALIIWMLGPIPLAEIGINIDFVPLDIAGMLSKNIGKVLLETTLSLGRARRYSHASPLFSFPNTTKPSTLPPTLPPTLLYWWIQFNLI